MKYKIGDKVTIKSLDNMKKDGDHENGYIYFGGKTVPITPEMHCYTGKEMTIEYHCMYDGHLYYVLSGTNRPYFWPEEVLTVKKMKLFDLTELVIDI